MSLNLRQYPNHYREKH